MRLLRWLRQRIHCTTRTGTCPFCEAWKQSSVMAEWHPLDVPGRTHPEKNPNLSSGR
jgi:hypothetical protein